MKVLIAGAGIAGLGAASYFSRLGHDVTVVEASTRPGGRALTVTRPGSLDCADVGTQYFHTSYRRGLKLLQECRLRDALHPVEGAVRIFDPRLRHGSFLFYRRFPWYRTAGVTGNLRLGQFLAAHLLRRNPDSFALTVDAADRDEKPALAYYRDPVVQECIINPLLRVGALSDPEPANPGLHHLDRLIDIILFTGYLSLRNGTDSLHHALAGRHRVLYDTPVRKLLVNADRVTGFELEDGRCLEASHVVVAVPPPVACKLLPEEWTAARAYLGSISMPPFTLPTFFLDRPLEKKNIWSWLVPPRQGSRISYIVDAARKNPEMVPSGHSVIQPWVCYPDSAALAGMTDDEVISTLLADLEQLFPGITGWVEHAVVTRHPYGVPFHGTGHARRSIEFLHAMDAHGVSFCGDYLSGGYMESALWSAERAAKVHGSGSHPVV